MKTIFVSATALLTVALLSACGSDAPRPLQPKNISAPLNAPQYLPPGLSTTLKAGQAVAMRGPVSLLLHPQLKGDVAAKLPPGALVKLKARVLNAEGPWWLVDASTDSGWVSEALLLRQ